MNVPVEATCARGDTMATGFFAGAMKLLYVIQLSVLVLAPTAHAEEFGQEDWRKLGQEATRILSEYI